MSIRALTVSFLKYGLANAPPVNAQRRDKPTRYLRRVAARPVAADAHRGHKPARTSRAEYACFACSHASDRAVIKVRWSVLGAVRTHIRMSTYTAGLA
ncbi:hypothetical protein EVAR_51021_1 [Eumeta japonica]|uniref:Uncharacterized protein n=1 Tax=Eumeta variegata TaxID=151549 RepID=A0A4C1Y7D0_EUMVA|nr:hypothetical protein EVAR_51021_1 [Eumeta japonica]